MMRKSFIGISVLLVIVINHVTHISAIPVEKDLTLTYEEKRALEKLKRIIIPSLPHDYMKKEIFLIKWLRRADLDVLSAARFLKSHLAWRKERSLDSILYEDFGNIPEDFPIETDIEDYTGRPVIAADAGQWNVRGAVVTGLRDKVEQFAFRAVELSCHKIREKQARGENVTQMQIIFDLQGYNLVQHGCLNCLSIYLNFVIAFQNQYPGMADNIIFLNTPSIFQAVLEMLRPISRIELREAVQIFGSNKSEWRKYVFNLISPHQLPKYLGGTHI